jgi:lipopolysaccharide export system protein LptC
VAWAKVLLPLAALALLSTVFLLAREPGGPVDIPYARLEEIARDPRIDRPRLAGVAPDGTTVALSAERVTPLPARPEAFALQRPRLETVTPDGASATLLAAAGEVDGPARRLRLSGGVRIESSAGYAVDTAALSADLATGTLTAGPVTATAPLGRIEAGGLRLSQGEGEGARLVFNEGVRVLYQPPSPPDPEAP